MSSPFTDGRGGSTLADGSRTARSSVGAAGVVACRCLMMPSTAFTTAFLPCSSMGAVLSAAWTVATTPSATEERAASTIASCTCRGSHLTSGRTPRSTTVPSASAALDGAAGPASETRASRSLSAAARGTAGPSARATRLANSAGLPGGVVLLSIESMRSRAPGSPIVSDRSPCLTASVTRSA